MTDLYQYKKDCWARLCEVEAGNIIQNAKDWFLWPVIKKGDIVMFIERLAYTEKTTVLHACHDTARLDAFVGRASIAARDACSAVVDSGAGWEKAFNLWKQNKQIPGGIYLFPTGKLVWISDIDIKYFKKVKAK